MNLLNRFKPLSALALAASILSTALPAVAGETLRLSAIEPPQSTVVEFANEFAARVGRYSDGQLEVKVFPASQLGDWVEVHEQVMEGTIDLAIQPLSNTFNEVLALQWFPYAALDFESGRKAFSEGGVVFDIINQALAEQDIQILGAFVSGMGGIVYTKPAPHPRDPNAEQGLKIRVWPGGTTHQALLDRLGYKTAPIPWSDLYTAMQTGVVDGAIGATPELTMNNFADIAKMWVQNNDHFEVSFIAVNKPRFDNLPPEQRNALKKAAAELSAERFKVAEQEHQKFLQQMRDKGIEVVELSKEELERTAAAVRSDVWPQIEGEIGAENLARLKVALGIQ
ncbi:TRAP transporter substrate-binding protein DctP [Marinobacterium sp. D7]|uniref:TRAP transporter substrate-binding protein DctP n=1 Tax=Marinobacterium ramblicola TaxID=2849041 RepID=UPI001C2CDCF9|nr:TRAP transporter substrate-binding protein DctP [Marinobacterium ramblicola]MBV1788333.1 TRAP transporter substrate-binding protein DctP [Marinobacterium ramblicola]